jgi:hypothetical protein
MSSLPQLQRRKLFGVIPIWGKEVPRGSVGLQELSLLWMEKKAEDPGTQAECRVDETVGRWKSGEICDFYSAFVAPNARVLGELALRAVQEILTILDKEGDCPSVVNREYQETDPLVKNYWTKLTAVTLREHSLNVARESLYRLKQGHSDYQMLLGRTLIAALGHDLGKLPSAQLAAKKRIEYRTGYHPIASYQLLEPLVKNLPYGQDVLAAVRQHHMKKVKHPTTRLLKEADTAARGKESRALQFRLTKTSDGLNKNGADLENQEQSHDGKPQVDENQAKEQATGSKPDEKGKGAESKDKQEAKQQVDIPKELDLPWLDFAELFLRLKPYINAWVKPKTRQIVEVETGYWLAMSFKDGLAYVQPKLLRDLAMDIAHKAKEPEFIFKVSGDADYQKRVEFTVASAFRRLGYIADTLGKGYTGAKYKLKFSSGKILKGYYTPFKAEVFGDFNELERNRTGRLAELTALEQITKKDEKKDKDAAQS